MPRAWPAVWLSLALNVGGRTPAPAAASFTTARGVATVALRDGAVEGCRLILDTRGRAESKTNTAQFNLTQSTDRARRSGVHKTLHLYTRALGLLGQRASVHSLPVHP